MRCFKIFILGLLFSGIFLASCSNGKDDDNRQPEFSSKVVDILVGGIECSISFTANGTGDYNIVNLNPDIAAATFDNTGRLVIETSDIGEATVRAVNVKDDKIYCELKINSMDLHGNYGLGYRSSPSVNPDFLDLEHSNLDSSAEDLIRAELIADITSKMSGYYDFDAKTGNVKVTHNGGSQSPEIYHGTFTWDRTNQELSINYNSITVKYTTGHIQYDIMDVYRDLTKDYQALYPDAGITKVGYRCVFIGPLPADY